MWGSDPRQYRCGAGQTGRQPSPPQPQIALSCAGELRGARQGRASSPRLGLCYLLLFSKEWFYPSCSSAGTLWEAGKQAGPACRKINPCSCSQNLEGTERSPPRDLDPLLDLSMQPRQVPPALQCAGLVGRVSAARLFCCSQVLMKGSLSCCLPAGKATRRCIHCATSPQTMPVNCC